MTENKAITIDKKDVFWNYLATFMQIGSGVLLYPLILNKFPADILAFWTVFMSITALTGILDFGFSPSFSRNITYILSGVRKLQKKGIDASYNTGNEIDITLFSSTYGAMKWFYKRISILLFILLSTAGTFYIAHLQAKNGFSANEEIWTAWMIFILTNVYQLLTQYYDALFTGMGKIKTAKKFIFFSQSFYIIIAIVLVLMGSGLVAVVTAQFAALIIRRFLSYFYLKNNLLIQKIQTSDKKQIIEIIRLIMPNAIKVGITSLGAFMVLQSSVIIGSFFVNLKELATYGINVQLVNVVASIATVYYSSKLPEIASWRVKNELYRIKKVYYSVIVITLLIFAGAMFFIFMWGNDLLILIDSNVRLLPLSMLSAIFLITFLEKNHAIAGGFLLMKNEVPFFKAAIFSGIGVVLILLIMVGYFQMGLWGMILAPGIVQLAYQNWKWPMELLKDLKK